MSTPQEKNRLRQSNWLKKNDSANSLKKNADRVKKRAENGKDVRYTSLVQYNLDVDAINEVREEKGFEPITVPEAPAPDSTAALALALNYKRKADEAIQAADTLVAQQRAEVEEAQAPLYEIAQTQYIDRVGELLGPDLSMDEIRTWYKFWFSPTDNKGNLLPDPEYADTQKPFRYEHYPLGTLKPANFSQYVGLKGFWTKGSKPNKIRISNNKGKLETLLEKMGCKTTQENVIPCITQRVRGTLKLITTANKRAKTNRSTATSDLQTVLWFFDTFPLVPKFLTKEVWEKARNEIHDAYQNMANKNREERNDIIPPDIEKFSDILKKVVATFGADSKESLFMHLFQVVPVRDNFGALKIVREKPSAKLLEDTKLEPHTNIIYIPKTANGVIIFYLINYKTNRRYRTQEIEFKKPTTNAKQGMPAALAKQLQTQFNKVSKMLRAFVKENPTEEYLFTQQNGDIYASRKLGESFIKPMLDKLDLSGEVKGATNYLRHAYATEFFKGKAQDPENKLRAQRMLHSPIMQESYVYKLKIDELPANKLTTEDE